MKIFKVLPVSIDFGLILLNNFAKDECIFPNTNAYFQSFLKFAQSLPENFEKTLKVFQKIAKFPLKFSNHINSSLIF